MVKTKSEDLTNFGDVLKFTFRFWSFIGIILLISIYNVVYQRLTNWSINPLMDINSSVDKANRILYNTCEQLLLAIISQLELITHLSASQVITVIPTLNMVWFVARILFIIGYPDYRIFGFVCGAVPHIVGLVYSMYSLLINELS